MTYKNEVQGALSTIRVAGERVVVRGDAELEVKPAVERCLREGVFCDLANRDGGLVRVNPSLVEEVEPFVEYEPWVA